MHKNSFFNKLNLNINKQNTRGITLIALVITIIVLLILAGVSISMLTGTNGILTQAQNAKQTTEKSAEQEKVQIAVSGSRNDNGQLSFEKLKAEIENQGGTILGDSIPTTIKLNNTLYRVSSSGEISQRMSGGTLESITGTETSNTTVQDALGNQVVVPAGFKIINPNDYVTDGIIIEDIYYENTKGSQFVWIPVGNVKTTDKGTINIALKRYVFNENGTVNATLSQTEPEDQLKTSTSSSYYFTEGLENSQTDNTHAKNIVTFKTKAESSHGYYIGRYEARDKDVTEARTASSSTTNQLVCTAENYVYNYIKQPQAATLSRGMYTNTPFESDLINSYAWDTATLFFQTVTNNSKYSRQNSLNIESPANQGTNKLDISKQDEICNVYDMASNCSEWSTETYSISNFSCTIRGGRYNASAYCTSSRNYGDTTGFAGRISFRPILYL